MASAEEVDEATSNKAEIKGEPEPRGSGKSFVSPFEMAAKGTLKGFKQDLTIKRIVRLLGDSHFFSSLNEEDLTDLAKSSKTLHFEEDEIVIRQGQHGDVVYFIADGVAAITKGVVDNPTTLPIWGTRSHGEYFGELALLLDTTRVGNVYAQTQLRCVAISRKVFLESLDPIKKMEERRKRSAEVDARRSKEAVAKWKTYATKQKKAERQRRSNERKKSKSWRDAQKPSYRRVSSIGKSKAALDALFAEIDSEPNSPNVPSGNKLDVVAE